RYRLDGEHDRVLADWEQPARKALQLELEAARLALCEEAVLRDLLRRCGVTLPPGYARADAVNKLLGGSSRSAGGGGGGGGPLHQQHPSAPPAASSSSSSPSVNAPSPEASTA
ncbi:unnamed protein product, partial [Scytosiphon promiscuus]